MVIVEHWGFWVRRLLQSFSASVTRTACAKLPNLINEIGRSEAELQRFKHLQFGHCLPAWTWRGPMLHRPTKISTKSGHASLSYWRLNKFYRAVLVAEILVPEIGDRTIYYIILRRHRTSSAFPKCVAVRFLYVAPFRALGSKSEAKFLSRSNGVMSKMSDSVHRPIIVASGVCFRYPIYRSFLNQSTLKATGVENEGHILHSFWLL